MVVATYCPTFIINMAYLHQIIDVSTDTSTQTLPYMHNNAPISCLDFNHQCHHIDTCFLLYTLIQKMLLDTPYNTTIIPNEMATFKLFLLSLWFVSCHYGASFNNIILPHVFINVHYTAIDRLLPQHRKPPDPQHTVKIHIESNTSNGSSSANAITYQINQSLTYIVSKRSIDQNGSLIDRGANGSIAGADVRIIETNSPVRSVNVRGIDNHELTSIPIVTCAGVVTTQKKTHHPYYEPICFIGERALHTFISPT